jgi:hypothetical protein
VAEVRQAYAYCIFYQCVVGNKNQLWIKTQDKHFSSVYVALRNLSVAQTDQRRGIIDQASILEALLKHTEKQRSPPLKSPGRRLPLEPTSSAASSETYKVRRALTEPQTFRLPVPLSKACLQPASLLRCLVSFRADLDLSSP